ncbi:solute carrier family 25 member 45 isoform 4-T4 [Molossus nigricans]
MPVEEFVAGWISAQTCFLSWREGPHSQHLLVTTGALGLVLGHPFDTVKVRLQTQTTYQGIIDCMVKTYRHESLQGFFKGMSFPIASIAVVNSVLFGVYSNTLLVLTATSHHERRFQPPSYTQVFIAGCTGGFLQAYILAPFDLIKVRLQNQTESRAQRKSTPPRYRGPVHCAASIFQEEGPRGLFRGAWALTLRDTPTLGIYFVTYEWLCRQPTPDGQNPSSTTVLVAGGFAGITSWVAATPLDVIKSRMQMAGLKQREYQGLLDCMWGPVPGFLLEEGVMRAHCPSLAYKAVPHCWLNGDPGRTAEGAGGAPLARNQGDCCILTSLPQVRPVR